jgi:hypothetical protein
MESMERLGFRTKKAAFKMAYVFGFKNSKKNSIRKKRFLVSFNFLINLLAQQI